MFRDLDTVDWTKITNENLSTGEMASQFYETIWPEFGTCFPLKKARSSSRDPPFMSPLVKYLLKKRKQAMRRNDEESITRLQSQINRPIHSNQVNAVKSEKHGSKKWWNKVNNMTGRIGNILPISSIIDPDVINTYFQSINTDPEYIAPQLQCIPKDTRIPSLSIGMVYNFLRKLKRTTSGPDDIPYWFWKTFAEILAPVMMRIFNTSLESGKIPNVWKRADIIPFPKENLISSCSQLRPISLTNIIMRLFEKCVYQSEIADIVYNYIGDDQFAYKKGHNSPMALIKYQHMWLKSLEEGAKSVRVISFDFSKAFDNVPHDILFKKIKKNTNQPIYYKLTD